MSAWRLVRWKGLMPMRRRSPSSSITWFEGCVTRKRSTGDTTCSYSAQAASAAPSTSSQAGTATPSLRLRLLRVDQDERDAARLVAAVHPRVIGRLLHHDVAGFQMHL